VEKYYLGCDVSKGYCDFVILDQGKKVQESSFQLDDTFEGHVELCRVIHNFLLYHPDSMIYAGLESTGGYENNWYQLLWKLQGQYNIQMARLNPLGVHNYAKAALNRNTTDKISARHVAEYLITHEELVSYNREDYYAGLRRQWKFVRFLKKQKAGLLNQLESLLYNTHPHILTYCKDGMPEWVLKLTENYPTALSLAGARAEEVAEIPYVSEKRAEELIKAAQRSIASASDPCTEQLVRTVAGQVLQLQSTIKGQEKLMMGSCKIPEIALLKSFTGIGDFSALGLMLEIGTIERFRSVKALASYFGLHPVYRQSGDGLWGFRMSKMGRKEPRWILFMVAQCAIIKNEMIRELYLDYLRKGKTKMQAIGIIMHKILRIIYGMLKNSTSYDPRIDRANRNTAVHEEAIQRPDKARRFQGHDNHAPVSRRQTKKRKEQAESQNDTIIENGIITPAHEKDNAVSSGDSREREKTLVST
jgi:transposase